VVLARPFIPEPKVFFGPERDAEWYVRRYAELCAEATDGQVRGEDQQLPGIPARLPAHSATLTLRAHAVHLPRAGGAGLLELPVDEEERPGNAALRGSHRAGGPARKPPSTREKAHARPYDYLCRGDYATFARRFVRALGRDNVAFFLYEDIERRADDLLRSIQEFIGVDPLPFSQLDVGVVNSASEVGPERDACTRDRLKERMAPKVRKFAELSNLDLSAWQC
jgi:hypothetical protein